jgi:hypothetical protein
MRATRFWRELYAEVRQVDPDARWWPPSRDGAADDFIQLGPKYGHAIIPNATRAEEWLGRAAPRPQLQAVPDLPPPRRRARPGRAHGQLRERVR